MNGIAWAVMGLCLGLALPAAFFYFRQRSLDGSPDPAARTGSTGPAKNQARGVGSPARTQAKELGRFRAVSVRPGLECCEAVQAIAGKRMLGREAPVLPLPECNQPRCQCTYIHHKDRRSGEDRRSVFGTFGGFGQGGKNAPGASERRESNDRRRQPPTG